MPDVDAIKDLLSHLEEEHSSGKISQDTYNELKLNYESKIKSMQEPSPDSRPISEDLKELKEKIAKLTAESGSIDKKIDQTENVTKQVEPEENAPELEAQPTPAFEPETPEDKPISNDKSIGQIDPEKIPELSLIKRIFHKPKPKDETHIDGKKENLISKLLHHHNEQKQVDTPADSAPTEEVVASPESVIVEASTEQTPEPIQTVTEQPQTTQETPAPAPEPEKKPGLLGNLFHKKEPEQAPPPAPEPTPAPETQVVDTSAQITTSDSGSSEPKIDVTVELEKLKVVLDTIRESKKATDETLSNIFESIGEIRSMSFQTDASLKELTAKLERVDDEVNEISPKNYTKKINDLNEVMERHNMSLEKLDSKSSDLSEKINQTYTTLKTIGNIENLTNINKDLQRKISDINEVTKYIERISVKAEKTYIDLNDRLGDFVVYKSKQDGIEETMKDIIKTLERLNVGLEGYAQKKDLDNINQSIVLMQGEIQELDKALPIVQMKVPEAIMSLKTEKDDIMLLLNSLKEQVEKGKIAQREYERIKLKNEKKLNDIDKDLKKEWGKLSRYSAKSSAAPAEKTEEPKNETPAQSQPTPAAPSVQTPAPPAQVATPAPTVTQVEAEKKEDNPEAHKRGRKKKEESDEPPPEKPKRKKKKKASYEDNDFSKEAETLRLAAEGKTPPSSPAAPMMAKPTQPAAPKKDEKKPAEVKA